MSKNIFTDGFLIKPRLAKRLEMTPLWVVFRIDVDTGELLSLDYQNAFVEQRQAYSARPGIKGKIEFFLGKLDRAVLMKTEATTMDQLLYDTREFLDILRNAEGRVIL